MVVEEALPPVEHGFTHFRLTLHPQRVALRDLLAIGDDWQGRGIGKHLLAEGLRREVGPKGIRVSLVEPGIVVSGFGLASVYIAPLAKWLIGTVGLGSTMLILGLGFLVVSHNMDELAHSVERVVLLDGGRVVADGPSRRLLSDVPLLHSIGLDVPQPVALLLTLRKAGWPVPAWTSPTPSRCPRATRCGSSRTW